MRKGRSKFQQKTYSTTSTELFQSWTKYNIYPGADDATFQNLIGKSFVLSMTYCVNVRRNLGSSRFEMTRMTEAGAHPPGFTAT